jgi:hypothetical protein
MFSFEEESRQPADWLELYILNKQVHVPSIPIYDKY